MASSACSRSSPTNEPLAAHRRRSNRPNSSACGSHRMLTAERAESERLRQIIKELQRHRFGRRAESLPEEQLQLGLEEAEQVEAAGQAESEEKVPAERKTRAARRRANRGALSAHQPRIDTLVDVASMICPGCSGPLHRIGEDVAGRLDIVPA